MYRGRLECDLKIWVDKGLVDAPAASAILGEYDSRPASFSAGRVLTVMAALLVGAAILLFVASNWEAIPRIVRLLGLVALIWAFYLGAAYLFARGRATIASALLILGTMTFGGAMSLVGQMYNISGDVLTMMIVWFATAGIAAALFRSSAQVALAGFLAWGFCGFYLSDHSDEWYGVMPWVPPIMAAIIIVLVRYVDVPRARHLAYLMLVGWLTWLFAQYEGLHAAILLAAAGLIAFLAVSLPVSPLARIARTAGAAPAFYAFLVGAIGLLAIHGEISGGFFENDIWVQNKLPLVVLAFITLASAIIAIILGGRDNGALRYLAYFVFACEILYLANETVGSIIGTSGFFLISGMLVAIAAWLVIRLERRFSHGDGQGDKA
ncbi:DUF2157 domain-containing protein [Agrobacterium rhizogenes]|uniref:DUF2157 domain-containing protein n=1 Tax=Rhizobium rhizogenes NBRC 13257 TaxID=1220581 RepID=A0AA87QGY9_RHIRH|nr:DUF2157 domain-containing protein [Rhizobium rhizogenes]KAA6490749.1 DUF2157 domain-containing protein [Agrobacterium sp. ICMP 7243]NTF48323.1 DUF2157 domain-containing protein [Rhizobium rhizogenes]NTF54980.1 DUF2157 domain-containing protein [Rhizobium rhizogenes]NTF74560.1 DUF2157 domain-containing protein [Rhizobium rhizogenes]NTF93629.1 DUF2157 domain-containing protein [Rhizobium rhizogenes]